MIADEIPTADEIRRYLDDHGITQMGAARMCRIDPRTFRRYVSGEHDIPYCVWYTLVDKVEG